MSKKITCFSCREDEAKKTLELCENVYVPLTEYEPAIGILKAVFGRGVGNLNYQSLENTSSCGVAGEGDVKTSIWSVQCYFKSASLNEQNTHRASHKEVVKRPVHNESPSTH